MRTPLDPALEAYRIHDGPLATTRADGNNGAFRLWHKGAGLAVIVSDGLGWDHVSVSCRDRTPTWEEMCYVKDRFFLPDECAVEYHPPRAVYRNHHPFTLHMWRPQDGSIPLPLPLMVAPPTTLRETLDEVRQAMELEREAR